MYDMIIRGGHLVDPGAGRDGAYDIAVRDGRIAAVAAGPWAGDAALVVDARGRYVTPGLVDLHTHCYWGATYWGIDADPVAARTGVTTWVDAGSAGAYTFPGFRRYAVGGSRARVLGFLNITSIGLAARTYELNILDYCDVDLGAAMVEAHRDLIVGIKARIDRDTTRGTGLEPLRRARRLADRVGLPLMVHVGMAPPQLRDIVDLLRPGDILTHCCTGQDNRLIDAGGQVYPFIRRLWEEGVILDLGHGSGSFSYDAAEAMLAAGMPPDVISSDIHQLSVLGPLYDLPSVLSKYLNLGMPLRDVIARATVRPAAAIGRPELGRLEVGASADIAVFRLEEGDYTFRDVAMRVRHGPARLINTATYRAGALLPLASEAAPAPWVAAEFPVEQRPALGGLLQGAPRGE